MMPAQLGLRRSQALLRVPLYYATGLEASSSVEVRWMASAASETTLLQRTRVSTAIYADLRVRFHVIRNESIQLVGKSQSCMVSKLRIIWKQTVCNG